MTAQVGVSYAYAGIQIVKDSVARSRAGFISALLDADLLLLIVTPVCLFPPNPRADIRPRATGEGLASGDADLPGLARADRQHHDETQKRLGTHYSPQTMLLPHNR